MLVLVAALAPAARGQRPSALRGWAAELAGEPGPMPKLACKDLRSLTRYEFSILTTVLVAPTPEEPEHCRVSGLIQPEIRFQVNLPTAWNGRFYMFGNRGMAGEPMASFAATPQKLNQAYYGALPARSYFARCSTGGRQGLILAQRFPADRRLLHLTTAPDAG